jgi:hypothetical protein
MRQSSSTEIPDQVLAGRTFLSSDFDQLDLHSLTFQIIQWQILLKGLITKTDSNSVINWNDVIPIEEVKILPNLRTVYLHLWSCYPNYLITNRIKAPYKQF